ncbi:MAG: NAD-dependent DNA ligase LigA [Candidatus Omnitrophota bacterium]|nr:NAD-dependent DNA ligase LigA [Candidatus Omnitrophota bacterium]
MDHSDIKKEIEHLRQTIRDADYRYYVLSDPEISDKEYDVLMERLKTLEEQYPRYKTADSPTQRVSGGLLKGFSTVSHNVKMLSLDNTYSIEELHDWEDKILRMLPKNTNLDYIVELKVDGVSCAFTYERGKLTVGATRGDGETGEDVTANIRTIAGLPLLLRVASTPEALEVRGEIYMEKRELALINRARAECDEPAFANPRNATSGSLKLLDPRIVAQRNLQYYIHSFGWTKNFDIRDHREFLKKINKLGLRTNPHNTHCKNLTEAITFCHAWQEKRDTLAYEIDGVVIKVNNYRLRQTLGATMKSPRWAVAYKFPAHQATTTVTSITFGVGRTGIITPVADLAPVECAGVTISRSTLHNFDEIERLDVREGDTVLIERAGEVIPKILKVITTKRTGHEKKIKVPHVCPECKEKIIKEKEEEVYWYCANPDCPARLKRTLLHFASRPAMDIEGMGESLVDELVNRTLVTSLVDMYRLKKEDVLALPLFAQKKADNIINAIEESKSRGLGRFLFGLGIRHIGEKAALMLAGRFRTIDALLNVTQKTLQETPEIGPVMAASLVNFFKTAHVKKMIAEFKKHNLLLTEKERVVKKSAISGKTFIFTGELQNFSRNAAQKTVESLGAQWVGSISKNVDFVVIGAGPGSKLAKATALNLTIIDENEFMKLLES